MSYTTEEQLKAAIKYIEWAKERCGSAKTPIEEHLACWDVMLKAPIIINNKIEAFHEEL